MPKRDCDCGPCNAPPDRFGRFSVSDIRAEVDAARSRARLVVAVFVVASLLSLGALAFLIM